MGRYPSIKKFSLASTLLMGVLGFTGPALAQTFTPTQTPTPTRTFTATPTSTSSVDIFLTAIRTATFTPTRTFTPTPTSSVGIVTMTWTPSVIATSSPFPSPTASGTPPAIPTATPITTAPVSMAGCGLGDWSLNGSAQFVGGNEIQFSNTVQSVAGSAWAKTPVDLSADFNMDFTVFLGYDPNGSDGIAFVLQGQGPGALGGLGVGLGYGDLNGFPPLNHAAAIHPSVAVEIDTHPNMEFPDPAYDHMGVVENGIEENPYANVGGVQAAMPGQATIKDGHEHDLNVAWSAASKVMRVSLDGRFILEYDRDMVSAIFGGTTQVLWGLTGSTGGGVNLQYFRVNNCGGGQATATFTPTPTSTPTATWTPTSFPSTGCQEVEVKGLENCAHGGPELEKTVAVKVPVTAGHTYRVRRLSGCISYGQLPINGVATSLYGTRLRIFTAQDAAGTGITLTGYVGYASYAMGGTQATCDLANAQSAGHDETVLTATGSYFFLTPDDIYGGYCLDNVGSEMVEICEAGQSPVGTATPTLTSTFTPTSTSTPTPTPSVGIVTMTWTPTPRVSTTVTPVPPTATPTPTHPACNRTPTPTMTPSHRCGHPQPYPNPCHDRACFSLDGGPYDRVVLSLHTLSGREIRRKVLPWSGQDECKIDWDLTDDHRAQVCNGIYYAVIETQVQNQVRRYTEKVCVLK